MLSPHRAIKLFLLALIALMVAQCTPASLQKDAEVKDMKYSAKLKPKDFPREIARLEKIAKTHSDMSVQARAHLQLAMLFLDYKNPAVNYLRALRELEAYISLNPEGGQTDEIQTWRALLSKIELLTKENNRIKEENQKMNNIIENMKSLDIQLEQKRKKY
ncbi:MAG: hypothetical protein Q7T83_11375 [Thermodesulfovibrionales bacterium]|nr:hypothetical protein [Thermodesulfovibrionales bacterium]MDP3112831.1 hypothetical protein [Thermodesulfovibrionales bacterium]